MADGSLSRVLVTGGAGFIGRHVVRALLDEGHEVTTADKHASSDQRVRSVVGDLCDPAVIDRCGQPADRCHHPPSRGHLDAPLGAGPGRRLQAERRGDGGLLEQARLHGVGTVLLASTNAVTGDVGRATITERLPLSPLTPYGATKAAAEMLLPAT